MGKDSKYNSQSGVNCKLPLKNGLTLFSHTKAYNPKLYHKFYQRNQHYIGSEECVTLNNSGSEICSRMTLYGRQPLINCLRLCEQYSYAILRSLSCLCLSSENYIALHKVDAPSCNGVIEDANVTLSDCRFSATEPKGILLYARYITNYSGTLNVHATSLL